MRDLRPAGYLLSDVVRLEATPEFRAAKATTDRPPTSRRTFRRPRPRYAHGDTPLDVLTTAELAARLKVSPQAIREWWHAGRLPEPLLPSPRTPRWRLADIERWEATGCKPAQLKAYKR